MKSVITVLSIVTLAAVTAPAYAGHAKAGLWKISNTALVQIANARADHPQTTSGQFCRTAAEVAKDSPPTVGRDCTQKNVKWNGNNVSGETVCAPPLSGTGKFKVSYVGDSHYAGTYDFNGSGPGGGPFHMSTSFTADWQAADCGKVKPLQ